MDPKPAPARVSRNETRRGRYRRVFLACLRPTDWALLAWKRSADVATGTVKWFNATKGYALQPDSGGKDVFVRISAVEKARFHQPR
jgi:hypothetical protein